MPIHGVAVTIPEPWGPRLQAAREEFGDPMAAAIPPHVTLLPPTLIEPHLIDDFLGHLRAVTSVVEPFAMILSGTGTFRPVSPVVFVTLAEGISQCEQLADDVRDGPLDLELNFPYHPHVTVAHHLGDDELDRAFDDLADFDCSFDVTEFHLYVHEGELGWQSSRSFPLNRA
jgi:2'-5' RNA ligase